MLLEATWVFFFFRFALVTQLGGSSPQESVANKDLAALTDRIISFFFHPNDQTTGQQLSNSPFFSTLYNLSSGPVTFQYVENLPEHPLPPPLSRTSCTSHPDPPHSPASFPGHRHHHQNMSRVCHLHLIGRINTQEHALGCALLA